MARAGDGTPRSSTRQRSRILRARVTPAEESRIRAAARRRGYRSVADYIRDRALDDAAPMRMPAAVIGELGILGGIMTETADLLQKAGKKDYAQRCRAASQRINRLQRMLMEDEDAGEGDHAPAPPPAR
ncbi:hypothetical protein KTN05_14085 [Paracoccus sp. Z118]|uniref:plasmid mobilization protein n=1 Tax=Paracoccus sp. Z118 TaxID=2851017 RepID=UPI001C2BB2CF|nr:hypothetical protein [Paracoccus sp. Z118]MBV0892966.1 hypothetical protein [Paracoccus sp. Z118]